jgi:serine protease Do
MDDLQILDAVERYIRGEMNPDERLHFENLRKTNAEIDQLVVEHTLFLQQMNQFGERQKFKATLNEVHTELTGQGKINSDKLKGKAKIVYLWNRYKRVTAIAASIAGITAIGLTTLVNSLQPPATNPKVTTELVDFRKELIGIKETQADLTEKQADLSEQIKNVDPKIPDFPVARFNGTGFLIDPKGMMITNAHVIKKSKNVFVQNNKGEKFKAIVIKQDLIRDIAIIKIDDDRFKPYSSLPYGFRKSGAELAEPIFTLGFPRQQVVYGEGYMSSKLGVDEDGKDDTLSCQITVPANFGSSGGPVFNEKGEVVGILTSKLTKGDAVFAIKTQYIYKALEEMKKNELYRSVKLPSKSSLAGFDRQQQVKKLEEYVFIVKGD